MIADNPQKLYLVNLINANFQDILKILEDNKAMSRMFILSSSAFLFSSKLDIDAISDMFKEDSFLVGLNFLILDITDNCKTETFWLKLHPSMNTEIDKLMKWLFKFFDPEDIKDYVEMQDGKKIEKFSTDLNIDNILEKINERGMDSLSKLELEKLKEFN